jgi:hypothetical protein
MDLRQLQTYGFHVRLACDLIWKLWLTFNLFLTTIANSRVALQLSIGVIAIRMTK